MNRILPSITLEQWDERYLHLKNKGLQEPFYGGPLSRHVNEGGDIRLKHLRFDSSVAALRLWNFLLTENDRLVKARREGDLLVGSMKDLGTVPLLAFSMPGMRAFYPDGAWWTPCLMECGDKLLQEAESLGIDNSFCPVRAMLAAFENREHFPIPDALICSAGAVCDDFSAIAQRLEHMGHKIEWWEVPRRRKPEPGEAVCVLPGGEVAPEIQVRWVADELRRLAQLISGMAGRPLAADMLRNGIQRANEVRDILNELRAMAYYSSRPPIPALEMLIAEMLAIHFCSDLDECRMVLSELLDEASARQVSGWSVMPEDAVRVYWVNPVADLRAMNRLEEWGGRLCGSDYMFKHALDLIPEGVEPFDALARCALADPMVGPAQHRAARILAECESSGAEALVVSRIPGASHSAYEGVTIRETVSSRLGIPTVELEIPSLCDAMSPVLETRIQALLESARANRPRP